MRKLVHSAARPLQNANASLVCILVPSAAPEKVCKKKSRDAFILRAYARDRGTTRRMRAARPRKLHIPRFRINAKARPFRCSSSPKCKRCAGLHFGSILRADAREFLAAARPERRIQRRSSSQAPYPSLPHKCESSSIPLLVLSKMQTLRWFAFWF